MIHERWIDPSITKPPPPPEGLPPEQGEEAELLAEIALRSSTIEGGNMARERLDALVTGGKIDTAESPYLATKLSNVEHELHKLETGSGDVEQLLQRIGELETELDRE